MLRISLNWPKVLKSWYVCVMKCSIDIVHVRCHTCQLSTIQNQEISGGLLYSGVFSFGFILFSSNSGHEGPG